MKTKILKNGSPVATWDTDTMGIDTQDKTIQFFLDNGVFTRTGGQAKDGSYFSAMKHVEPSDKKFIQAFYDVITLHGYTLPPDDARRLTQQFLTQHQKSV